MHHVPAGPPLSARLARALSRCALGRRAVGHRSGRLALSALLSTVVTALVLAVPVVGGAGTPSSGSAFVLGPDGQPLSSSTFAGLTSAATFSSATGVSSAAPSATRSAAARDAATAEPSATGSLPGGTGAPVPPPAPVPVPEPAPVAAPESVTEPAPSETAAAAATPESSAPAPAPTPVATPARGPEAQVLALVNAERAAAGCDPVLADDALAAVARAHSEDMRDRGFFDHVNPDGLDPFDRAEQAGTTARAENIAAGQQDAAAVMSAWMNSPGHRANILNCSLTRLGAGVATGSGGPWWTQLFG